MARSRKRKAAKSNTKSVKVDLKKRKRLDEPPPLNIDSLSENDIVSICLYILGENLKVGFDTGDAISNVGWFGLTCKKIHTIVATSDMLWKEMCYVLWSSKERYDTGAFTLPDAVRSRKMIQIHYQGEWKTHQEAFLATQKLTRRQIRRYLAPSDDSYHYIWDKKRNQVVLNRKFRMESMFVRQAWKIRYLTLQNLPSTPGMLQSFDHLRTLNWLDGDCKVKGFPKFALKNKELMKLELQNVEFSSVPEEIRSLSSLESLTLRYNKMSYLPDLEAVTRLEVVGNPLKHLPKVNPENIVVFHFEECQLAEIPRSYFAGNQFTNLLDLNFARNQISEIPHNIFTLTELVSLDFSHNQITHIPDQISALGLLNNFHVSNNFLQIIPETLYSCTHLVTLNISSNRISELSTSLDSLVFLESLNCSNNKFEEIPQRASRIGWLNMSGNPLKKVHPLSLKGNRRVDALLLSDCNLEKTPSFPLYIQELDLSCNGLTEITSAHYASAKFVANDNQITTVSALPRCYEIQLKNNKISEKTLVPRESRFSRRVKKTPPIKGIRKFDLSGNLFKIIPDILLREHTITELRFARNNLEEIPEAIAGLPLRVLDISYNNIKVFPDVSKGHMLLNRIYAGHNKISSMVNVPLVVGGHFDFSFNAIEDEKEIRFLEPYNSGFKIVLKEPEDPEENLHEYELLQDLAAKGNNLTREKRQKQSYAIQDRCSRTILLDGNPICIEKNLNETDFFEHPYDGPNGYNADISEESHSDSESDSYGFDFCEWCGDPICVNCNTCHICEGDISDSDEDEDGCTIQ